MKKRFRWFFVLAILMMVSVFVVAQTRNKKQESSEKTVQQSEQNYYGNANYKSEEGYVPNEETAIAIAVAVWNPIYGKEKIENEKPFHANLKDGVWTVKGSLPKGFDKGGTAIAEISKDDGRIIRIMHEK